MIIAMEHALHQPNALIKAEELQEIVLLDLEYAAISLKMSVEKPFPQIKLTSKTLDSPVQLMKMEADLAATKLILIRMKFVTFVWTFMNSILKDQQQQVIVIQTKI